MFEDLFKHLFGMTEPDYTRWVRVGVLTPEEKVRRRELGRKVMLSSREASLLEKKMQRIKAEVNEVTEEWWNDLYRNHSLPIGNYHVMDDGAIVMEPKEPTNGDKLEKEG